MSTIIQIKRSSSGVAPSSLADGELAVDLINQVLYTSNGSSVFAITVFAPGGTGSNTDVLFNDSGTLNTSAGFSFNKTTNNVTIANNLLIGSNVDLSTSSLLIGNSTVNSISNSSELLISNSTSNASLSALNLSIGNSSINVQSNSTVLVINSNTSLNLPVGNTAQRPSGSNGNVRYNGDTNQVEFFANGQWGQNGQKGVSMMLANSTGASNGNYYFTGFAPYTGNIVSICAYSLSGGTANVIVYSNGNPVGVGSSLSNVVANTTTTTSVATMANSTIYVGTPIYAQVNNSTIANGNALLINLQIQ